ncbi:C-type lectin domain family 1 member A [Tachyglossus aculeatus]|uniref:C-type lectin domain family 1 member A n=1 Tax=Tachyglossus aculeatus TaxID=9261 RepID=UPI0018F49DA1|nr:C-type lectin domain family 1 member A [Tachyglossus aculeatus]
MRAKHSSTQDMLEDDGDTTLSLHSRTSTAAGSPKPAGPGHVAPTRTWRPVALTLLILCFVLLFGLGALGFEFFQVFRLSNTQRTAISQQEERLGNLSQQLQDLQAQNRKLTGTLQQVAQKLCWELYNKTGEHRCSPCPEKWFWRGNSCFHFYRDSRSWWGCEGLCSAENASLLKIDSHQVLELVMPLSFSKFFYSYWTGLSRNGSGQPWVWLDGSPHASDLFQVMVDSDSLRSRDCVTILNGKTFSKDCKELRRCACQRAAELVRPEELD